MRVIGSRLDMATATLVTTLQPETEAECFALGVVPWWWITTTVVFRNDDWHDARRWEDDGGRS